MTPARLVAALLAALATVTVTFTTAGLVVTTALDGSDLEAAEAEAERSVAARRTSTWTAVSGVVTRLADTETVVVVAALVLRWRGGPAAGGSACTSSPRWSARPSRSC